MHAISNSSRVILVYTSNNLLKITAFDMENFVQCSFMAVMAKFRTLDCVCLQQVMLTVEVTKRKTTVPGLAQHKSTCNK